MKRKKNDDRYNIENLPIREEMKEVIKSTKLSDIPTIILIHTICRIQGMQEECIQEMIDEVLKELKKVQKSLLKLEKLEDRVAILEDIIKVA